MPELANNALALLIRNFGKIKSFLDLLLSVQILEEG